MAAKKEVEEKDLENLITDVSSMDINALEQLRDEIEARISDKDIADRKANQKREDKITDFNDDRVSPFADYTVGTYDKCTVYSVYSRKAGHEILLTGNQVVGLFSDDNEAKKDFKNKYLGSDININGYRIKFLFALHTPGHRSVHSGE